MTEVVRGFLYPKYIARTSSGCIRIGTCSFWLWCDERKKNENLKVRNMFVCGILIYFSKGRQKRANAGLLNREDRRFAISLSTGK